MDKNELFKTAALAKLKMDDEEADKLAAEVSAMLDNFSAMMEADVKGLEPTTQTLQKENRTRSDSPGSSNLSNNLLDRVPEREDRFIVIPNVM
ncbi:Asp-tRNA(Asn)/Glu-tRNA(Gln) amidotransferase subunit GatC [Spirochaeta isovalerica]|uniref:Glutamyl-tRNA(Gln) amidotransferase subunit C n=1 Tax=Spirochaeta isovalerica TaxID=150 RepID=A0A841RAT7_9SPIO|nr:Asp-tRNA(Asn)/Glu-tRNA(Gln) amidotransferase subunit GatC [Spirochaeta isovalerica]MBB6480471.1 aspartyl-tRNA(Asn)/glutamyl-tRNA(Gln) amidotransferase subunit C [Spirochaeta isovalerica]